MDQRRNEKKGVRFIKRAVNTLSFIIMILGVSLLISTFAILLANDMFALIKDDATILFVFDKDKTLSEVADTLADNDIIEYGWAFKLFAKLKNIDSFEAGKFELNSNMDYGQIIDMLTKAPTYSETVTLTIPEGFNIRQIAELVDKAGVCKKADFIETATTYKFKHEMLKDIPMIESRLEGYLFPDTYEFYINDKPVRVINKMLNNFVTKYNHSMIEITNNKELKMSEVIIIASLIEREAKIATERTAISGVIYNRLKNPEKYPYLQIDATLLYSMEEHKTELTADDKEIDSLYNTYKNKGLPPTAICNPGISSILAAIYPDEHKYYYYVVDDIEKGSHVFAKTLDEHNANVAKYKAAAKN